MSGGFIVEASDDEEDDAPQPSGSAPPQNPGEETDDMARGASAVPAPTGAPAAQAAAPIGVDPIALLEARVKEDPRGDMDAWLSLIANHRRRNNMEALRDVYNRFVGVFPQAVSYS